MEIKRNGFVLLFECGPFVISKVHVYAKIPKNSPLRVICEVTAANMLHLHNSEEFSDAFHICK